MTEQDPPRPYLNYGLSKLQAEWAVMDAHRAGRIEAAIARPCWFYGPNQPARQTKFLRMIKSGRPVILGRGSNLRSLTYVDNAVQGLLLLEAVEKAAGETYWIADRRPYSFIEIVQTVAKILGVEVRPRYLPSVGSDVARFVDSLLQMVGLYQQEIHVAGELTASIAVSIDAARRDLGYDPEIELEEGMRRSDRLVPGQRSQRCSGAARARHGGLRLLRSRRGRSALDAWLRRHRLRPRRRRRPPGRRPFRAGRHPRPRGRAARHRRARRHPPRCGAGAHREGRSHLRGRERRRRRSLLEAARVHEVPKTVLVSSSAVFGSRRRTRSMRRPYPPARSPTARPSFAPSASPRPTSNGDSTSP